MPDAIDTEQVTQFNGIAVINQIKLGPSTQNCKQFAEAFLEIIKEQSSDFQEI